MTHTPTVHLPTMGTTYRLGAGGSLEYRHDESSDWSHVETWDSEADSILTVWLTTHLQALVAFERMAVAS